MVAFVCGSLPPLFLSLVFLPFHNLEYIRSIKDV